MAYFAENLGLDFLSKDNESRRNLQLLILQEGKWIKGYIDGICANYHMGDAQFVLSAIYDKEKDESDLYRLIFTINPYCTNILFNTFTEVVYKEGSDICTMLTDSSASTSLVPRTAINTSALNQSQAIRDTEYSHPSVCEGLVYHCGTDIFNNHILRSDGFVTVHGALQKVASKCVFRRCGTGAHNKDT